MLYLVQLILLAETVCLTSSRNHSLPNPWSLPTLAVQPQTLRFFIQFKRTPRPHGWGIQLPHYGFHVLQESVQVHNPKHYVFQMQTHATEETVFSWDQQYDLTTCFNEFLLQVLPSSSSLLKGEKASTRDNPYIQSDTHCTKELSSSF